MEKFIPYLSTNDTAIIAAILTITVLGFSIFASLYSSLLHNAETADGNMLQSNKVQAQTYWIRFSAILREQVQSRAFSANLCFWSLVSFIATFILHYLYEKTLWAIPLSISLGFVFVATANFILNGTSQHKGFVRYLKYFRRPIIPEPDRLTKDC
jgi:predicted PurR-regulated permease PerM